MSAQSTKHDSPPTDAPAPEDVQHYVVSASMDVANELGVDFPALCGEWGSFSSTDGPGDGRRRLPVCPKCQRAYDDLPRD